MIRPGDVVVMAERDVHAGCSFSAVVFPRVRACICACAVTRCMSAGLRYAVFHAVKRGILPCVLRPFAP